jgi:hypothetical protein
MGQPFIILLGLLARKFILGKPYRGAGLTMKITLTSPAGMLKKSLDALHAEAYLEARQAYSEVMGSGDEVEAYALKWFLDMLKALK